MADTKGELLLKVKLDTADDGANPPLGSGAADVRASLTLTNAQMAKLFTDAGFTFRSMVAEPVNQHSGQ